MATSESTSLNRLLTYLEYDNFGRVTAVTIYDGDGVTPVDSNSDGVPDAPSQTLRRGRTETVYDQRGQVAQTKVYGANATGTLTFTPYVTDSWYDARGQLAKVSLPGGVVEKYAYDGLGQLTVSYVTDGGGDANYTDALTVTGDSVLSQAEYDYDAAGNLILVITRDWVDGETGTGELGDMSSGVAARVTYAGMYYDAINRLTDMVEVGTNGGSTWTRPSTVPTRSDTVLVTSYGYDAAGYLATVTDPLGIVSQTAYDALGRVTAETRAYGTADAFTTSYGYDSSGRLLSITLPGSRETRYGYDSLGRVDIVAEHYGTALERSSTSTYNRLGEITSTTDAMGAVTAFTYDILGQVVSITEAVGDTLERTTSSAYDALGRVIAVTDPRGYTTTTGYDDIYHTVAVVDPYGNDWTTTTDLGGRVTAVTDPLGKSTTYTYDVWGRLTSTSDPLSNTTTYAYTITGDRDTVTDPRSNMTQTVYDDWGRVAKVIDALSNSTEYEYDRDGRLMSIADPRGTPTGYEYDFLGRVRVITEAVGFTEERETSYDYNLNGDLVTVTDPRGTITRYVYDAAGRVSTVTAAYGLSEAQTTSFLYDDLDRTISVTAPGGLVTESGYDALGRLSAVTEGVGTLLAQTTTYGYDTNDNLVTVTDPLSHTTAYGYDKRNLMVSITDAESGVTTIGYDERGSKVSLIDPVLNATEWSYDDAGRLTNETDPLGKSTTYTYDTAGNLVSITDRLGQVRVFTVDDLNRVTTEDWYASLGGTKLQSQTFSYDANGNLLTATDPDGSYTLTYDRLNRVSTVDGPFLDFTFAYDDNGNRTSVTDSTGAVETSSYDALNRLTSRELGATGVMPLKAAWSYDAAGLVDTLERFGWSGSAWVSAGATEYTYDDLDRLTGIHHADASNSTLGEYTYSYDLADRLTGQTIDGDIRTFDYDDTNQITDDDGTSYSYDANGNRTNSGYITDHGNRLSTDGVWTYSYDDAGRMVGKSKTGESWTYEYDLRGQLVAAEQRDGSNALLVRVEYLYDAFGNRIGRTEYDGALTVVSDERFVVDGWNPAKPLAVGSENFDVVADLASDGLGGWTVDVRRTFGDGVDELLAKEDGSAVSWYGTDRQGSVRVVFDNVGVISGEADYDAWGNRSIIAGTGLDRYAYTGREWDDTLGLQYNRGRMYDPATGRWTGEDPIGIAGGDPNAHRYVGNGPTHGSDPSGLKDPSQNAGYTPEELTRVQDLQQRLKQLRQEDWEAYLKRINPGGGRQLGHQSWSGPAYFEDDNPEILKLRGELSRLTWGKRIPGESYPTVTLSEPELEQWGRTEMAAARRAGDVERARVEQARQQEFWFNMATLFATGIFPLPVKGGPSLGVGFRTATRQTCSSAVREGTSLLRSEARAGTCGVAPAAGNPVRGRLQRPFDQRCFPADTPVATEAGDQSISRIERGMKVWACDPDTGNWSLKPVLNTFSHAYEGDVIAVGVAGTVFRATGNHPVWVVTGEGVDQRDPPEHTPASSATGSIRGRWVEARGLRVGDRLLLRDGDEAAVESLVVSQEALRVYNVEVAEDHTYAVGTAGVLVHNKSMEFINPPDTPVGKVGKPNDKWFHDRGLDPHQIKDDLVGGSISKYDVFKDQNGNLWVFPKNGRGEPQWWGRWVEE
ncbi:MAG: hypothetical protein LC104_01705 [Bacteroidales bacterium]|nr:hypothetical protein [Bacteroidales bacterium]